MTIRQVAEPDAKRSVLASKIDSQQRGWRKTMSTAGLNSSGNTKKRGDRLSVMEALDVRLRLAWSGSCVCAAITVVVQVRNVFRTQAFSMAWKGGYLSALTPAFLLHFSSLG